MVSLLAAVRRSGCTRIVFSSSCSVYGTPATADRSTRTPRRTRSARTATPSSTASGCCPPPPAAYGLGVISLRYFNVVGAAAPALVDTGAHNLVPVVVQALQDGRPPKVYGDDYPTPDGTCVRDYVDVRDVADAHVAAAAALEQRPRVAAYNVGRGEGSSVLEVLDLLPARQRPRASTTTCCPAGRATPPRSSAGWSGSPPSSAGRPAAT